MWNMISPCAHFFGWGVGERGGGGGLASRLSSVASKRPEDVTMMMTINIIRE